MKKMLLIFKEFTDSLGSEIKRKIEVCFLGAVIIKFGNHRWECIYFRQGVGMGASGKTSFRKWYLSWSWSIGVDRWGGGNLSGRQVQRQTATRSGYPQGAVRSYLSTCGVMTGRGWGGLGPGICRCSGEPCWRCWWVHRGDPGGRVGVLLLGDRQGWGKGSSGVCKQNSSVWSSVFIVGSIAWDRT